MTEARSGALDVALANKNAAREPQAKPEKLDRAEKLLDSREVLQPSTEQSGERRVELPIYSY